MSECFAKQRRSLYAAITNRSFLVIGPTAGGNAFAREVDHYVEAFHVFGVDLTLIWMPLDFGRTKRARATYQSQHFVSVIRQRTDESFADESM